VKAQATIQKRWRRNGPPGELASRTHKFDELLKGNQLVDFANNKLEEREEHEISEI